MKPVINLDEIRPEPRPALFQPPETAAERYGAMTGQVAPSLGLAKLGCNVTVVPPGKRAFPMHNHYVNDELFLILEGSGELRIADDTWPLRVGDVIGCPAGGTQTAHQIINTGASDLRYLCISTKLQPDIVEYPGSAKFAVMGERPATPDGKRGWFRFVGREDQQIGYWEGE
ncbi:MAG: cupin domain-containing protein [Steroidobacteraceae bacterium]